MSSLQSRLAYLTWKENGGDPEELLRGIANAHAERLQEATKRGAALAAQQFKHMQDQAETILKMMKSFDVAASLDARVSSLKNQVLSLEETEQEISRVREEVSDAFEKAHERIENSVLVLAAFQAELQAPPRLTLAQKGILVFLHVWCK